MAITGFGLWVFVMHPYVAICRYLDPEKINAYAAALKPRRRSVVARAAFF